MAAGHAACGRAVGTGADVSTQSQQLAWDLLDRQLQIDDTANTASAAVDRDTVHSSPATTLLQDESTADMPSTAEAVELLADLAGSYSQEITAEEGDEEPQLSLPLYTRSSCTLQLGTHDAESTAQIISAAFFFFSFFFFFFYYVHTPSSKIIKKDNDTETRTNVTTIEQGLHRDAAVMVGHLWLCRPEVSASRPKTRTKNKR